jgi:hypothetical protein
MGGVSYSVFGLCQKKNAPQAKKIEKPDFNSHGGGTGTGTCT